MVEKDEWLIRKDGYFYRPNCQGYTTHKHEAGRYTKEKAEKEASVEPWHMKAIHESEWPDDAVSAIYKDKDTRIAALEAQLAEKVMVERTARALLNNLWGSIVSGIRSHEENWADMEGKYPGATDLHACLSALEATPPELADDDGSMTPEEIRLENLKQLAAYSGPVVSFDVRDPYYLASCNHCGWVGSTELCGTDSYGDDSDVYCPRCNASGADSGKVASRIATPTAPEVTEAMIAAALENYSEGGCMGLSEDERREVVISILTAAQEAGKL